MSDERLQSDDRDWLSVVEAATVLGVSENTVRRGVWPMGPSRTGDLLGSMAASAYHQMRLVNAPRPARLANWGEWSQQVDTRLLEVLLARSGLLAVDLRVSLSPDSIIWIR